MNRLSPMDSLTPPQLLAHRQCPRRLWLSVHRPGLGHIVPWHERRDTHVVQDIARRLYPEGSLVASLTWPQVVRETTAALARRPRPILNAAVEANSLQVRVDLLLPLWRGYRLVKLAAHAHVARGDLEQLAMQSWVARQAHWTVSRCEVAHIDAEFRYPGREDYRGLFLYQDVTRDIRALEGDVPAWLHAARATLLGTEPELPPGPQCDHPTPCPFLTHCDPAAKRLPPARTCETQSALATKSGAGTPHQYLTVATLSPAVPVWEGLRPHRHLPLLWLCGTRSNGDGTRHKAFISDASADTRRAFAYSLLQGVGNAGPVWVANEAFVRARLQELAEDFPDLAPALSTVAGRLVLCTDTEARAAHERHLVEIQDTYAQLIESSLPEARRGELRQALPGLAEKATLALTLARNARP